MSPYTFTYIIPYKHRMDRFQNLKRVIDWVAGFKGVEIILVEQDRKPKIQNIPLKGVKYYFIKSELPFNKALTFNVGLKYATTNIIVFGDSDIIMDPQDFSNAVMMLKDFECVSPYNRVIDLKQEEIGWTLEQMKSINRPGRGETDIQKICLCGGIIAYRKDAIQKIGGFCENFIGWGAEDDYQSMKSKRLCTWIEHPSNCYHLFHQPERPDMKFYQRNLQILNQGVNMSDDDLKKSIAVSIQKIGMKNKYDNYSF